MDHLFMCRLFDDVISYAQLCSIKEGERVIMYGQLERIWKEALMAYFKVLI